MLQKVRAHLNKILLGCLFTIIIGVPQLIAQGMDEEEVEQLLVKTPDQAYVTVAEKANLYEDAVMEGEEIRKEKEEPKSLDCGRVAEDLELFRRQGLAALDMAEPSAVGVYSFGKKSLLKEAFHTATQSSQDMFINGITESYAKAQACRVQGYPDAYTWERELGIVMARLVGDETLAGDTDLLLVQGVDAGDLQSLQVMASKLDKISRRLVENSMFLERFRGLNPNDPLYEMHSLESFEGKPKSAGEVLEIARDVQGALNQIERMEVTPTTAARLNEAILDEMDRYEPCLHWTFHSYQTLADKGHPLAAAKAESLKYLLAGPRVETKESGEKDDIYDRYVEAEVKSDPEAEPPVTDDQEPGAEPDSTPIPNPLPDLSQPPVPKGDEPREYKPSSIELEKFMEDGAVIDPASPPKLISRTTHFPDQEKKADGGE